MELQTQLDTKRAFKIDHYDFAWWLKSNNITYRHDLLEKIYDKKGEFTGRFYFVFETTIQRLNDLKARYTADTAFSKAVKGKAEMNKIVHGKYDHVVN